MAQIMEIKEEKSDDVSVKKTEEEVDLYADQNAGEEMTENEILGQPEDDVLNSNGDHIDEKALLEEDNEGDLFDDVITEQSGQVDSQKNSVCESPNADSSQGSQKLNISNTTFGSASGYGTLSDKAKRFNTCYVGNMTWWANDQELANEIASLGMADLLEVKFYENRANGQSRGFAMVTFGSQQSCSTCMEKISSRMLHGQQLIAMPYNKSSLTTLEAATRPTESRRNDQNKDKVASATSKDSAAKKENFLGSIRIGHTPVVPPQPTPMHIMRPIGAPPPGMMMGAGPPRLPPLMSVSPQMMIARPGGPPMRGPPPPGLAHMHPPGQPPMMMPGRFPLPLPGQGAPPPTVIRPPPQTPPMRYASAPQGAPPPFGVPPPGAHINPNVYPGVAAAVGHPPHTNHGSAGNGPPADSQPSAEEFEEIMSRNRTVSSSAISRAVSDAAAGDYASAIETLVTAISLIRQSRVANDDRCKVLITSLQDTLHGIEAKSYTRGSRAGDKRRERSRSRERSSKRHRRSSRSRSRSRDRYEYSPRHSSSRRY